MRGNPEQDGSTRRSRKRGPSEQETQNHDHTRRRRELGQPSGMRAVPGPLSWLPFMARKFSAPGRWTQAGGGRRESRKPARTEIGSGGEHGSACLETER